MYNMLFTTSNYLDINDLHVVTLILKESIYLDNFKLCIYVHVVYLQ